MASDKALPFDPYHKWLAIPTTQRPPTHYQLLGVAPGESDVEVIEEAAIRQTTHVRAYQVGPNAESCARLLNEIAKARQVLVDPRKRKEYDQNLAASELPKKAAKPIVPAKPAVAAAPAFAHLDDESNRTPASQKSLKAKSGKNGKRSAREVESNGPSRNLILGVAVAGGALVVGLGALVAVLVSSPAPQVVANNDLVPKPPVVLKPIGKPQVKPIDPPINLTEPQPKVGEPSKVLEQPDIRKPSPSDTPPVPEVAMPKPPALPPVPKVTRIDAPTEAKIKEVEATVHASFKADYVKRSAADRIALAEKLLQLAREPKEDAAARYVLFCEARDLAVAAGNWSIAEEAFEQIQGEYKVDLLPQREAALRNLLKSELNKEALVEATDAALQGMRDAIVADQLPLANSLLGIASTAAAKSLSVPNIGIVKKAEAEVKAIAGEADAARQGREQLKRMPADPAANFVVGRYDALRRREWQSALPVLAKGGDDDLAALARKDSAGASDGAARQKIGDEWWALAEKEKESAWIRSSFEDRAAHWYRLAAPKVSGLELAVVTERLKTIEENSSPFRIATSIPEAKVLKGHTEAVKALVLMPDGKRLYSGSMDSTMKCWDLKLAKKLSSFSAGQPIYELAFSPDGRNLAIGFKDTMNIVDVDNPTTMRRTHRAWPGTAWLADNHVFCLYTAGWATSYIGPGGVFSKHNMKAAGWVYSQMQKALITYGEESWLCRIPTGRMGVRKRIPLGESTVAAFSPSGQAAAIATTDKKVQIIDVETQNVMVTLEGSSSMVRSLAYSPNGDRLITGGEEGSVRIWNVASGKQLNHFDTGSKGVTSILVTPDNKQIITGGSDGVIRIWSMPRDKAAKN
jgi:anaphase-promoting complex subunit 4/WD40 domain-containing protein